MVNVDYSTAYNFIRERILSGEYPSDHPLKADILAKEIGLSRTPVRDALRQLDADGLVSIRPRMGARVRTIDLDEFGEICGLRMALEVHAVGLAARLRTESDLREIALAHESFAQEVERLITASDPASHHLEKLTSELLVREDIRFHMAITNAAKNRLIRKEILRQQLISRIVSTSSMLTPDPYRPVNHAEALAMARATVAEHKMIYEAVSRMDVAVAKNAMEMHLQEDVDTLLQRMARDQNSQVVGDLVRTNAGSHLDRTGNA